MTFVVSNALLKASTFFIHSAFLLTNFSSYKNGYEKLCYLHFIENTPLNPLCDLRPVLSTLERSQYDLQNIRKFFNYISNIV